MRRIRTRAFEAAAGPAARRLEGAFAASGFTLRLAGGAVRDSLLGRPPKDLDFATDATPEESLDLARKAGLKGVPTGLAHGTVTILVDGEPFEVTTLRADVACDGRHADVAFVRSFEADAARRDLTINAMFADLDGRLHDFHGGAEDLDARVVRFVGDPETRIREDYLRILRFFRFRGRFGPFMGGCPADRAGLDAIASTAEGLSALSGERVWSEVARILSGPQVARQLGAMAETGALAPAGLAELDLEALSTAAVRVEAPQAALGWAAPDADAFQRLAARWRMSRREREDGLFAARMRADAGRPLTAFKNLLTDGADRRRVLDLLRAAGRWRDVRELASWATPEFPVAGRDLLAAGMPEGPEVGRALARMKARWRDSGYALTRDELMAGHG